jgi:hypothetical protein
MKKTAKRIAIITIHNTDNYGAVLQAFALKKYCDLIGSAKILDYSNNHLEKNLAALKFPTSFRSLLRFLKDLLRLKNRRIVLKKFDKFIRNHLSLYSFDENRFDEKLFDFYISGSDQIWNPNCVSPNGVLDQKYFLSFVKNETKISYASSMGSYTYSNIQKESVKKLLSDFKSIAVRENDAAKKLSSLVKQDIKVVLDPTLLLNAEDFLPIANIESSHEKRFILVYSIQKTKHLNALISEAKLMFPKHEFLVLEQDPWDNFKACKAIRTAGPEDFLGLCHSAEGIITDSFHGVCFSMIFEKPFIVANPVHHPNRIKDLLIRLEEDDRLSFQGDDVKRQVRSSMSLNPKYVRLNLLRQQAFEYLNKALS